MPRKRTFNPAGRPAIDLTGKVFGYLRVIDRAENSSTPNGTVRARWNAICWCGVVKSYESAVLTKYEARSCGCMRGKLISHAALERSKNRTS